ncbi:MAG: sulfatase-like hydrolase/transferase [Flavobacteriaceae bacterium]|nr:sulfatase-like hydrolase/transferase [Flavobacteriaceae bacterium]
MGKTKKPGILKRFLDSNKEFPVLAAVAAGLYPVLFYYSRNFDMVRSWQHLLYFAGVFILLPIIIFLAAHKLSKLKIFEGYAKYVLPFLNVFTFLFFLKTFLFVPVERKIILGIFIFSVLFARFLYPYFKKVIVVELLLALIGFFTVSQLIYEKLTYSEAWMQQPDAIANVVFKKKPNVYFIEPDGYVSFSTLKNKLYDVENSAFEGFLEANNFKTYPDFRTNYKSTLSSNSGTFMMKHHFYDFNIDKQEVENARRIIMTDNPVLNAFKRNGYETYFLSESYYFLNNRPKLGYDYCNIDYSKIPFLNKGLGEEEPVLEPLKKYLSDSVSSPKFFFIQILKPAHINTTAGSSLGASEERKNWIERLGESDALMQNLIAEILKKDPESLIMIMADHGGFVGLDYTGQGDTKTEDKNIINSIFSTNLTIHWPKNEIPEYDSKLKTPVNVFRILFTYLSEDEKYLENLQPDESYICLTEGTKPGVYKYIDSSGNCVFEKMELQGNK